MIQSLLRLQFGYQKKVPCTVARNNDSMDSEIRLMIHLMHSDGVWESRYISIYGSARQCVHSTCAVLCLAEQNSTIIPSCLLSSTRISYPDTHTLTTSRLSLLSPFSPLVLISPTADSSLRLIRLIRLIHHYHHFPHTRISPHYHLPRG